MNFLADLFPHLSWRIVDHRPIEVVFLLFLASVDSSHARFVQARETDNVHIFQRPFDDAVCAELASSSQLFICDVSTERDDMSDADRERALLLDLSNQVTLSALIALSICLSISLS